MSIRIIGFHLYDLFPDLFPHGVKDPEVVHYPLLQ